MKLAQAKRMELFHLKLLFSFKKWHVTLNCIINFEGDDMLNSCLL